MDSDSLELEHLSKHYGVVRAVDDLDLTVKQGEFLTLLGPSGSGKTTTLRLIAGFIAPTSGKVSLGGRDLTTEPPQKRNIGMVFQNYALFPHMTVAQNIAFPLQMRKLPKQQQRGLVDEVLRVVRLAGYEGRYPRQLSGGQQQRVAFARAVVFKPRVLLMDEPLGALDKKLREALQLEIKGLHDQLGMTIVHVTHDQEEALVLSDRIAIFNAGRVEQLGSAVDLYEHPASLFVADFVGESNTFRGRMEVNGRVCHLIAGSHQFRCAARQGASWTSGEEAALVVRPEKVLVRDLSELADPSSERLRGRIRHVVYLGSAVKYELEVGEWTMFSRHDIGARPLIQRGTQVAVEWRTDDGILVPAAEAQ